MIRTEKNYIDGTAVRKIEYDVYQENKVLKAKNKARAHTKVKIRILLCIGIIFAAFALLMYRYALITDLNYKINRYYKDYESIKNENIRLTVEIDRGMDLKRIRHIAETELAMREPEKYQIVRLNITKNDYTKVAAGTKDKTPALSGLISFLRTSLQNITHWMY